MNRQERDIQTQLKYDIHKKNMGDKCPFCDIDKELNVVIEESEYWVLLKNAFPYENTNIHRLLVPRKHVESMEELSLKERVFILSKVEILLKVYDKSQIMIRAKNNAERSVDHLHFHIIEYKNDS